MTLSILQLHNIANTFYQLMRGVYDLKEFNSPYNSFIQNEFDEKHGTATEYFYSIYENIASLTTLFNELDHSNEEEYRVLLEFDDCREDLLEELTICSAAIGYLTAKNLIILNIKNSLYKDFMKRQLTQQNGVGQIKYNKFCTSIENIKHKFNQSGATREQLEIVHRIIDKTLTSIEQELTVFVDTAYSHGIALGHEKYPIWLNPLLTDIDIF